MGKLDLVDRKKKELLEGYDYTWNSALAAFRRGRREDESLAQQKAKPALVTFEELRDHDLEWLAKKLRTENP
jgi:hypothetical protein